MYRNSYILILAGIFFMACSNDKILSKEKMEKVLWEVAQSSEYLNTVVYNKNPSLNKAALNDVMLEKVCSLNKISKVQFYNTMEYYRKKPLSLKPILDSIVSKQKRLKEDTASTIDTSQIKNNIPIANQ